MRDDELRRLLNDANPWWSSSASGADSLAWTSDNRVLRDRSAYDLGYRAQILSDVAHSEPDGKLIVLTGPRRAGKTVALLDTAAALGSQPGVDARQIVHVPCDGMTARDLRRVITLGRALTRSVDEPAARRRVWLFDETSAISGWTAALKGARDNTAFGDDTVVATGSRWISSEDVQGNLLAGRAGTGTGHRIRQLMPMSFRDFLVATRPDLPVPDRIHPARLIDAATKSAVQDLAFSVDDFDLAWQDYLTCGGFPRAVAEHHRTGFVSDAYVRDLLAWLRADVDPDAPTESVPLLLAGISQRMTSPLNAAATTRELGYPNRDAFERRLVRLLNSHALLRSRQRRDNGVVVAGAQYKLYLTDPVLAWLPSRLSPGLPMPDFTALSEMTLAVTLARTIDGLDEGRWIADDTIGYLRTDSGNEIDLSPVRVPTADGANATVPIESKWVDAGWRGEARTIEGRFGRGVVATKSILDLDHPSWAVPAPIVAALLG
ncbi:AAA family ATPase [Jiangella alkaliphila]|uniref:Predicted ATPase, AAA+ superfamily n=1 Tax=Jiangella alkaliphila TaxID=419479 RepID=A0A1H2IVZ3_9ACTN|nr:AAA family ATPase [Jiangella alkaliphila]SDU48374.1 Predicted ATPase, AAA+ superfamily [Jiangella alkaliphila]